PPHTYPLSLHDALPIWPEGAGPIRAVRRSRATARPCAARSDHRRRRRFVREASSRTRETRRRAASRDLRECEARSPTSAATPTRSEEHTSELQSPYDLV